MRVLLADPPELFLAGQGLTRQVQPLGLAYVGAALADLADVRFLLPDTRAYLGDDPWGELRRTLIAERPDILGIGAVTASWPAAIRLAQLCRECLPETLIVAGGVHVSTEPAAALRQALAVDVVVQGEGEATLREITRVWAERERQPVDWSKVAGTWSRTGDGQVVQGPPRPLLGDLDALPMPLREGLVYRDDIQPAFYQAMVTLRGCPYHCIYCAVPSLDSSRTRYRSPQNVVDEIAQLRVRHGLAYLFFHDSVFTLHRQRTLEICRLMVERQLTVPFCIQTRADRLDAELLDAMTRAGLHQVFFGIESGDADSLRRIRKAMELERIRAAVAMTRAANVRTSGFFMIGWPWETEALMEQTAEFATSLDLDAVSLFSATPLPGTELWKLAGGTPRELASIDFRKPQVNLTPLSDAHYAEVFGRVSARIDAYNQARMLQALQTTGQATAADWQSASRRNDPVI
ncbi:MAG: radical SAM protein [Deltaproteobacteria bacterium]|nr:radical SAM protein [Deltaproteobacteria bacterium]